LQLQTNPWWQQFARYLQYNTPVGFWEAYDPYGDLGHASYLNVWTRPSVSRNLAAFTTNANLRMYYDRSVTQNGAQNETQDGFALPILWQFPLLTGTTNTNTSAIFHLDGWVMSASGPFNTTEAFKTGVGFNAKASPPGWHVQHDSPADMDIQAWAYGAPITEAGYGYTFQSKISHFYNSPAYNGLGVYNSQVPTAEYYSRIYAYTNNATFTYTALEGRGAYPVVPYPSAGGNNVSTGYATEMNEG